MSTPRRLDDAVAEIAFAIRGDTAAALAEAAARLRRATIRLAEAPSKNAGAPDREPLRVDAADALWAYVVQKELIGIVETLESCAVFGVTPELWARLGARPAHGGGR